MVPLELSDIQGDILQGYGFPSAAYLFLSLPHAAAGRAFLTDILDDVTTAEPWHQKPATTTNVALTYAGLTALDVPAGTLEALPEAFRERIRERSPRALDDTGESAPEHWEPGIGTDRSHLLVAVNAGVGQQQAFEEAIAGVLELAAAHGLELVHRQQATALAHRREHFGWADGFSQPAVEGSPSPSRPGQGVPEDDGSWRDLKAGEFVHGYPDEDGHVVPGPAGALLRNGTFMVYRKLYQDVARFRRELYEEAARYGAAIRPDPPMDGDQLYELMAAKVVGRWRDGVAISLVERRTEAESRSLGGAEHPDPDNDFRYATDDAGGLRCPKGAHIRRTNPRDALGWGGRMSVRHRIIRRGMPYGPPLAGLDDDGQDRGLVFICFNADIERQFEVVQAQWCNDGNAFRLGNDKDYLLGDSQGTGKVTIQGTPPHFARAQPNIVLTRGCEYLLMPGLSGLRLLASGG